MVESFWSQDTHPYMWARSPTKYASITLKELEQRTNSKEFAELKLLCEDLPEGAHVAGGYVAGIFTNTLTKESDVDIFFSEPSAFEKTLNGFLKAGLKPDVPNPMSKDEAVITLTGADRDIQLIKLIWHNDPTHIIDNFDFTCCQFVTDADRIYYNPMGLMDLIKKELVLHRLMEHSDVVYRLIKFAKKGFSVSREAGKAICKAIEDRAINRPAQFADRAVTMSQDVYSRRRERRDELPQAVGGLGGLFGAQASEDTVEIPF